MGNNTSEPPKEYKTGIAISEYRYNPVLKEDGWTHYQTWNNVAIYQTVEDLLQDIHVDDENDIVCLKRFVERNEPSAGCVRPICTFHGSFIQERLMHNGFISDLDKIAALCAGGEFTVCLHIAP